MVAKASGLDKQAESFIDDGPAIKHGRPKGSRNKNPTKIAEVRKLRKALQGDERDSAVVTAQETCGMCGEAGHGFDECPRNPDPSAPSLPEVTTPATKAVPGRIFFSKDFFSEDGWLMLPKNLPFEGYQQLVDRFASLRKQMLWIAGDLQVQGQALYGEKYSQVVEALAVRGGFADKDYTESTLSIAKTLSEKFPPDERHKDLSWSHHEIVMTLSKKERAHWLARAAAENLSTRELKAQIAAANGVAAPVKPQQTKARGALDDGQDEAAEVGSALPTERTHPSEASNGVSLQMLLKADAADKAYYDALDQAVTEMKDTGSFDYDALRPAARAQAAELIPLIQALGDPRAK